ncbi:hypothetical protein ACIPRL_00365 [Streptomyces sp. NPDC090085]|uniref:hypothetical protein n=1 Tax=Streptomyces sp. NPDC090085 TaxID=3365943 RepID=UPI00382EB0AD
MNPVVYVLGGPEGYRVTDDDWGAVGLEFDLLAGPDFLLALMRQGCAYGQPYSWRPDDEIDAGVVVDPDRNVLRLFVLEGPLVETYTRRAAFALLRAAWPGWEVHWIYGAQTGLRSHLGLDPGDDEDRERRVWADDLFVSRPGAPLTPGSGVPSIVVTLDGPDRCHLVGYGFDHPVMQGPALLDLLDGATDEGGHYGLAEGGVRIDAYHRRVGWWTIGSQIHSDTVAARWPGWTVEFWEDRWAEHRAASGGRFDPTEPDDTAALISVRDAALWHWTPIPTDERDGLICLAGLTGRGLTTRHAPPVRARIEAAYRQAAVGT